MQSACSGGTGTFIEKTARKLQIAARALAAMPYDGHEPAQDQLASAASSPRPTPTRSSRPACRSRRSSPASSRRWSTRTSRRSPRATRRCPRCCCSADRTCSSRGLQEAWRHHLAKLWAERKIACRTAAIRPTHRRCRRRRSTTPASAASRSAQARPDGRRLHRDATSSSGGSRRASRRRRRRRARRALVRDARGSRPASWQTYDLKRAAHARRCRARRPGGARCWSAAISAARPPRRWCCRPNGELLVQLLRAVERQSDRGREGAVPAAARPPGSRTSAALALTGYGKDLLKDILGADVGIVETVAHATAALHFFPDADVICDVGGTDVKIMILRQGTVADFRLNSQCSSGNGAFLQGVAERYDVPLEQYAEQRVPAPRRCRRWPWAAACSCSPTSSTSSARAGRPRRSWRRSRRCCRSTCGCTRASCRTCAAAGRKFVLQGGTHRNLAVVKAQVDFIRRKVPDAEIVVHPYSGEAGAIGAALCAGDWLKAGAPTRFRGYDVIESLEYTSTTNEHTTCQLVPGELQAHVHRRALPDGKGRPWSKVPLAPAGSASSAATPARRDWSRTSTRCGW